MVINIVLVDDIFDIVHLDVIAFRRNFVVIVFLRPWVSLISDAPGSCVKF
jgi:hypothetical protein